MPRLTQNKFNQAQFKRHIWAFEPNKMPKTFEMQRISVVVGGVGQTQVPMCVTHAKRFCFIPWGRCRRGLSTSTLCPLWTKRFLFRARNHSACQRRGWAVRSVQKFVRTWTDQKGSARVSCHDICKTPIIH